MLQYKQHNRPGLKDTDLIQPGLYTEEGRGDEEATALMRRIK